MFYKEYKPCKELEKYLKCFWIMERVYDDKYGHFENLWPTGLTELLFTRGPRFTYIVGDKELQLSNTILIGSHDKRFTLKNSGKVKIIGIRSYNHGANLLFGIDANKFKSIISSFSLEGMDQEELFILENSELIFHLNEYCKAFIKEDELLDALFKLYQVENISVEELSKEANLSKRQLERKVKDFTSFTAQELKTIIRFDKARLKILFTRDYLQVMNDMGYYDYSHFCRDFKRYYDVTPKQFIDRLKSYGKQK